ncbi:MAG: hypothetical protein E6K39_02330 [Gammaproteobacteria bacterium]|nr:MAG: hypothetical protein DMF76_13480 [Acidobacteriota bacterium]TLZ10571.1 MAG: hypothetical protein E6K39_02330 [Gammaproteobacteria bacterium]
MPVLCSPLRVLRCVAEAPFVDLFSHGRPGPRASGALSAAQIEQIRRTVRRAPEVMVKVTGGGRTIGAVGAHFAYISHQGELDLETDERVSRDDQKELLRGWHLELSSGQYREPQAARTGAPGIKLVHNITLSMPAPTPPKAVLAAAKAFAREKFGAKHRYAMALHTHHQHPHVHLVVKAEGHDGRRLHIDKAMLREWRQDFAQLMREQGIAANATPRSARGQTKRGARMRSTERGGTHVPTRCRSRSTSSRESFGRQERFRTPQRPGCSRLVRRSSLPGTPSPRNWRPRGRSTSATKFATSRATCRLCGPTASRLAQEMLRLARTKRSDRTREDDRMRDRTLERSR